MSDESQEAQPDMVKTNDPEVFRTALQIMRERRMYDDLRQVDEHDRWPEDRQGSDDPSGDPT